MNKRNIILITIGIVIVILLGIGVFSYFYEPAYFSCLKYISDVDKSTLTFFYIVDSNEAKNLIIPIVSKYKTIEANNASGFYGNWGHLVFTRVLNEKEQNAINNELEKLDSQNKISNFYWNYEPRRDVINCMRYEWNMEHLHLWMQSP